jgi:hypothetical protein
MPKPGRAFISYAREDSELADRINRDLRNSGIETWFDKDSLLPGQWWKTEIKKAIRECSYFLALLSSNSVSKKGFVQKEIKEALETLDEYPESKVFVIPVRLNACVPTHEKLGELHWVDLFPSYDQGLAAILRVLQPDIPFIEPYVVDAKFVSQPIIPIEFIAPHDNKRVAVQAVIDTGAVSSCIPQQAVVSLGSNLEYGYVNVRGATGHMMLKAYQLNLKLGSLLFSNIKVVEIPQSYAIIGLDILSHTTLFFDGPSRTFKIWKKT